MHHRQYFFLDSTRTTQIYTDGHTLPVRYALPICHLVERDALVGEDPHPEAQSAEHPVHLRAHEVREREPAAGGADDERAPPVQSRDGSAREVGVGAYAARAGLAGARLPQQRREDRLGGEGSHGRGAALPAPHPTTTPD